MRETLPKALDEGHMKEDTQEPDMPVEDTVEDEPQPSGLMARRV